MYKFRLKITSYFKKILSEILSPSQSKRCNKVSFSAQNSCQRQLCHPVSMMLVRPAFTFTLYLSLCFCYDTDLYVGSLCDLLGRLLSVLAWDLSCLDVILTACTYYKSLCAVTCLGIFLKECLPLCETLPVLLQAPWFNCQSSAQTVPPLPPCITSFRFITQVSCFVQLPWPESVWLYVITELVYHSVFQSKYQDILEMNLDNCSKDEKKR